MDGVIRGVVVRGGVIRGGVIRGGVIRGGAIRGSVVRGAAVRGGVVRGVVIRGGVIRHAVPSPGGDVHETEQGALEGHEVVEVGGVLPVDSRQQVPAQVAVHTLTRQSGETMPNMHSAQHNQFLRRAPFPV